ncbi:MAG: ATP-binding protein, partial [Bifidobacteriaceae bacterium]|nr:ATP-binding protein [Bifidobacteriaceae bacterium]
GGHNTSQLAVEGSLAGGDVCPVTAIYGANASGKSTVLGALAHVQRLIRQSARWEAQQPVPGDPFLLSPEGVTQPFVAELVFRIGAAEYRYGFEATSERFTEEHLFVTARTGQRRTERRLFARWVDGDGHDVIDVSPSVKGPKQRIATATRPNSLFLSKAAQENQQDLSPIYGWLSSQLLFPSEPGAASHLMRDAIDASAKQPAIREALERLLVSADLSVDKLNVSVEPNPPAGHGILAGLPEFIEAMLPGSGERGILTDVEAEPDKTRVIRRRVSLDHHAANGSLVSLPWASESDGTKALFTLGARVISALNAGQTLLIDEVDTSLHPLLLRPIIELFQVEETNPNGAQLVFTTHDATLLGNYGGTGYALDRDQIWFTEKGRDGATELVPLSDYKPRKGLDTETAYLAGRFGAVPVPDERLGQGKPE